MTQVSSTCVMGMSETVSACDTAAPVNISAPQVRVILARNLELTWQAPDLYTGPLTQYVLTAYNVDHLDVPPLSTNVTPLLTTGQAVMTYNIIQCCTRTSSGGSIL